MSRSSTRRAAALAVLTPVVTAGLIAAAGSASAIPFEGDPTRSQCLRVVALPWPLAAGSSLFVSHGHVLMLSSDC